MPSDTGEGIDMFQILGIIALSNVWAPWKALNLPSLRPLHITSTYKGGGGIDTREWQKYSHGTELERDEHGMTRVKPVFKVVPPMLVISGKNGHGHSWDMAIDLEDGTVGAIDWGDMTHYEYGGSGEIGLFIFGIPGLILTSPLWLLTNLIRGAIKALTPLDVDHWEVWLKLRGQFKGWDSIDPAVVWKALRMHQLNVPNSHNLKRHAEYEAEMRQEKLDRQFANWKDDYCDGPFMDRYAHGCAEESEVMKDYEDWQRRQSIDQNVRAHEWLGMTEDEFKAWHDQQKTILQLLEERENGRQPVTSPT